MRKATAVMFCIALGISLLVAIVLPKRIFMLLPEARNSWQIIDYRRECPKMGNALLQIVTLNNGYACVGNANDDWVHWYLYFNMKTRSFVGKEIFRPSTLELGLSVGASCKAHAFVFFWGSEEELRRSRSAPGEILRSHHSECRP
jgi:hypothetical protein